MTREEIRNDAATNYGYAVAGGCIERGYIQDAFERGAEWADAHPVNPWHKASEELPKYDVPVIVTYDGNTDDCCFNHRSNNPEVKTTEHDWCEIGYEGEPTHWMEIPEIKEG